jgi:Zn finger protein HypA/HybF involved in hydrogenase expression
MNLLKNAKENLLQTAVAILAIGAGVYLPTIDAIRSTTPVMLFLSLFAAFGGALLSKALEGEEKTSKRFRDQLRPIIRHLASITKELTSVTRGTDANQITNAESIKLIDQLVPNMIGAMTDLGDVVGEPFDPNTIYQTAHQVEELDKLLSSLSRYSKNHKQQALIVAAKSALAEIHPDVYKRVPEKAKCPHCNSENEFMLGQEHPASAAPICATCKQSFHVHRNKDHSIKTVAPGWNLQLRARREESFAEVKCDCGNSFKSRVDPRKVKDVTCNSCGTRYSIDSTGQVSGVTSVAQPVVPGDAAR